MTTNQKEATRKIIYQIYQIIQHSVRNQEIMFLCSFRITVNDFPRTLAKAVRGLSSFLNQSVEKMKEMVESDRRQNMKLFLMFNFP